MLVKVAIDLALDRLFAYSAPEGLEKKLSVGQLLFVPFGCRQARGFAMEIEPDKGPADVPYDVKPVSGIADPVPFFSPEVLRLVRKISAYTAAPVESVLRAAVPAAVVRPGARAKERLFVEPVPGASSGGATPRQRWLFENIVRLGGGWLQQLCGELSTSPATLRALASAGLVEIKPCARRRSPVSLRRILPSSPLEPNPEQARALAAIRALEAGRALLLHGVTGSGKTEVYLQAIASELEAGRGAIVMVPEIALTPQTVQRFASRFGDRIAVLHSSLSDGERYDEWHRIRSGAARVAIGPRSAVFAPVANLGLIVVDEEHETSYKQDDNPRYNARDAAVMRGAIERAKVVLGSATPSLETWANAASGKYAVASMRGRAGAGALPRVAVVDMSVPENRGRMFSRELLDAVSLRLDRSEQTMLFLNRRGYSRAVSCRECAAAVSCPACGVPFVYHIADRCLRCHVCGAWIPPPSECPACGSPALEYRGFGTQRAEIALGKVFPRARIRRMDADSTSRKNSHDDILGAFRRHEADILVGTQMIAKGLDFPNVTLVGVLDADGSLNRPDFRAAERTFQLLSQVAGRAGRAELAGEAFVQTYNPSAPAIRAAVRGDYAAFAGQELADRRSAFFPPFCHLSAIGVQGADGRLAESWAEMYAKSLSGVRGLVVGDAAPAALERADGRYRWQIVVRTSSVGTLVRAWRWLLSVRRPPAALRVSLDVDAVNLI